MFPTNHFWDDWANSVLLENYLQNTHQINIECFDKIYVEKNADFRRFRYV